MKRLSHTCKWKYFPPCLFFFAFLNRRLVTTSTAILREHVPYVKQRPANHAAACAKFQSSVQKVPHGWVLKQRTIICGVLHGQINKVGRKAPDTSAFAAIVRNRLPSLLLAALGPELTQEKQLLERLSHRHWKAISMRVGIGGDTYGPMHYPGMRSLWQSPANFHQHLALPSPLPFSVGPPTCLPFCLLPPQTHFNVPGCWPLTERGGGWNKAICSAQSHKVEGVQSCIVHHQTGTDCWYFKGRNTTDFGTTVLFRAVKKTSRLTLWVMLWKYEPAV